jgi:hypothetical protein
MKLPLIYVWNVCNSQKILEEVVQVLYFSLTLSYSSKINDKLYPQRVSLPLKETL